MNDDLISRQAAVELAMRYCPDDEIIRCKDCRWFDISEPSGTVEPIGFRCKLGRRFVEADNYCKYGERREE